MYLWRFKKERKEKKRREQEEKNPLRCTKRFHFQWARLWTNFHVWIFVQKSPAFTMLTTFDCHFFNHRIRPFDTPAKETADIRFPRGPVRKELECPAPGT
jgi:hypothetical protein